jgi:Ca2+-binding EF-hand superfamily protein
MESYIITKPEMVELKQTMGFRVTDAHWNELVRSHPNGCTSLEMMDFVKKWMDPPYKVDGDLDAYLEKILKAFVDFVRE